MSLGLQLAEIIFSDVTRSIGPVLDPLP